MFRGGSLECFEGAVKSVSRGQFRVFRGGSFRDRETRHVNASCRGQRHSDVLT